VKVLYIVSDNRSGSTLLQHLLGLQPGVAALGEIHRLDQMVKANEACACGQPLSQCPFWANVASHVGLPLNKISTGPSFRLLRSEHGHIISRRALKYGLGPLAHKLLVNDHRALAHCFAIYHAASEITGKQVVIDASKAPHHFLHLYMEDKQSFFPIFLIRDGRGVVWSKMKRTGIGAAKAAKVWLNVCKMILALHKMLPDRLSVYVKYEELCMKPEEVLERILKKVDIAMTTLDLGLLPIERHDVGGSPRFREERPGNIELDQRWRNEMPKEALIAFERVAGRMNRRFGYD
jgi:hypothetical protein